MKQKIRTICIILVVMLAAACLPLKCSAMIIDKRTWKGFVYTGFDDETDKSEIQLEILNYRGTRREVTIPTEIDGMKVKVVWSLSKAKNLRTLHIPNGVEVHRALAVAPKLKKITVSKSNRRYSIKNNALLNKKGNVLMGYPGGYSTLEVPDSVTYINGEFYGSRFKRLKLGKNVKKIGRVTFAENKGLETLVLDKKVQIIEGNAFRGCKKLKTVVLGKSVRKVGYGAFVWCDKLKVIYIYNKNCKIDTSKDVYRAIPDGVTVYGWKDSTAQKYAEKFHLQFVELKE